MMKSFGECSVSSSNSGSSSTLVDTGICSDDHQDDLEDAIIELQQEWDDATNDTNLDEVRTILAAAAASPTTQEEAMICDIQRLLARLIGKASQLLGKLVHITIFTHYKNFVGNCITNLAECWMHIRTKFDGGKQINQSQHGSWEGRCTGAGLHLNEGPMWGPKCWEKAVSIPANDVFVSHGSTISKEVEKDRK